MRSSRALQYELCLAKLIGITGDGNHGESAMHCKYLSLLLAAVIAAPLLADDDHAQSEKDHDQDNKSTEFELTIREGNSAYGTAAYSFRFSTQNVLKHRNLVDLVYNRCGQLHVNAHGGMRSRIADLGEVDFDEVHKAPLKGWNVHCIQPKKGHVYIQEVNDGQHKAHVKFLVADVGDDGTLKLKWSPVESEQEFPQFRLGSAGIMGQCGGYHQER
jgi:hypothetical protein